jgi:Mg2+-importing ATPase
MSANPEAYWTEPLDALLARLESGPGGLSARTAADRERAYRLVRIPPVVPHRDWRLFLAQFGHSVTLILIAAAVVSAFLGSATDAGIILAIILAGALLGFWQERASQRAVQALQAMVRVTAQVVRDGTSSEVPLTEVVPGDVVLLRSGDQVPADARVIEGKDLFVTEAALTGESYAVEKQPGTAERETPLAQRHNCVFMGTHVLGGTGRVLALRVGRETEFGAIAATLRTRPPEADFERGLRRFGYLLMEMTAALVIGIFAVNVWLQRPVVEAFLFATAIAVGLTPQMVPAILSINLSRGARRMARHRVIVRRLAAIENFGGMTVLCSDKTGTLTEGNIQLDTALDAWGRPRPALHRYAFLNAHYQTGFANPIDTAIVSQFAGADAGWRKLDEVAYDFRRRRLSVLAASDAETVMITKGAIVQVLEVCTRAEAADGATVPLEPLRAGIVALNERLAGQSLRTLALACRRLPGRAAITRADEADMVFLGLLVFRDPLKADAVRTVTRLRSLGIRLKVITGDNRFVAANFAERMGVFGAHLLTGADLNHMTPEALRIAAQRTDLFAEIEPHQKSHIIEALKAAGETVGFIGDGINDATALHVADVGISVNNAVDVAREAADLILLEKDLSVLVAGVLEGRKTFVNTMKYIFVATSANFGNMFSLAGASLLVPFLPLLPKQVLLVNLLTDFPQTTIATDRVDPALAEGPRRWDVASVRRFMLVFGLVSSAFDYAAFFTLLGLGASPGQFRTGWFVESILSATLVVLAVRTRQPLLVSRPAGILVGATAAVIAVTLLLPYSPLAALLGFEPLPVPWLAAMAAIVAGYLVTVEVLKKRLARLIFG